MSKERNSYNCQSPQRVFEVTTALGKKHLFKGDQSLRMYNDGLTCRLYNTGGETIAAFTNYDSAILVQ